MHYTYGLSDFEHIDRLQMIIYILVGRLFSKLVLVVTFMQCNNVAPLNITIFHWFYVSKTMENSFCIVFDSRAV